MSITMRIMRAVLILSVAVVTTACATSGARPEELRLRVIGADGQEIEQVVPLGVQESEPARPQQNPPRPQR